MIRLLLAVCLIAVLGLVAAGCSDDAVGPAESDGPQALVDDPLMHWGHDASTYTYEVTIENLSTGQPLSPPVAATHRNGIRMWRAFGYASPELEAIAEDGNEIPMFDLLSNANNVTDVVDIGAPLTRHGTVAGDFTDKVTFEITARRWDRFSFAAMLICTNDGFVGLNGVGLPRRGMQTYWVVGYDAGTEDNTEQSVDIVDACSALGPVALDGDPNGNEDDAVATSPQRRIRYHRGIKGTGDLDPAAHGWRNPVAKVTIKRISD